MALVRALQGHQPKIPDSCFLAETAVIIGQVRMGEQCSIWYNAVLRGDVHSIELGDKVNVQDNAMLHCTYQKHPLKIGNEVSIGHNAIVHGCHIQDRVLIGMGATVMDGCVVESDSIIAAGAVLLEGTHVPSGSVYAGVPAKKVKEISPELLSGQVERIAKSYLMYSSWYRE